MERMVGSKQDILLGNKVVSSLTLEEEHATGHCSVFQLVDDLQRINPVIPLECQPTARM